MSGERTEKPTQKRLQKARKDGQVARTSDVSAWAGVLVASVLLPIAVEQGSRRLQEMMVRVGQLVESPELGPALELLRSGAVTTAVVAGPIGVALFVVAVLAGAAQGGLHVATKPVTPELRKLDPIAGLKRMLGPQGLWEGAKTLLKAVVLGAVAYGALRDVVPAVAASGTLPLSAVLATVWEAFVDLLQQSALVGLVMAAADYGVVRHRTGKQLRMSKQDVKDEHKQMDGDPHVKAHIRSRQMAMGRNRMMAAVADADVVLVNPTHIAVALRYEPGKGAPRVVAKGAGAVALRIRERAAEHRVPVVQDVPLARALHRACEVEQPIPADLFAAVARVLAFVMSLKARGSAAGEHRMPALAASPAA